MRKKEDFSKVFHDRINDLLEDAGFEIKDRNYFKAGPDTICSVDGNKVLVQCKSTKNEGRSYRGIEKLIDEYATKVKKHKAKVAILAFEKYQIPEKYVQRGTAHKDRVVVWDDRIIDYYRETVDSTGEYAKYTIKGDLGISERSGDLIVVPAIPVRQNNKDFFIFKMYPEDLLKYSYVFRRQYNPKAYQRMMKKTRLKEIAEFIDKAGSVFPNAIICVFKSGVRFKDDKLWIPRQNSSIWIVDGQHRLYGFCHSSAKSREKAYELICVGFNIKAYKKSYLKREEQAELFSDINSKSKKIPQDLLLEIQDLFGLYDRRVAVVKRFLKTDLFKNKIQTSNARGQIHFATFVTTFPMGRLMKEDGPIIRYNVLKKFKKSSEKIRDRKYEDACFKVLKEFFNIIKNLCKSEWRSPGRYVLFTDRGIRALLRLLIEILNYNKGRWDKKIAKEILSGIRDFNFRISNLKGKYLGEAGAKDFANDLTLEIQKHKPDFGPQSTKISDEFFRYNEVDKVEKFVQEKFKNFKGEVCGRLIYMDESTIDYLKYIPPSCGIKLIVRHIKPDDRTLRKKIQAEKKHWRYLRVKKLEILNDEGKSQEKNTSHERWIADQSMLINLETDLKRDALNKEHTKVIFDNPHLRDQHKEFGRIWESSSAELEDLYNLPGLQIRSI